MPVDILIGLQWGDEGKGKIIDLLCPEYEIVARFQGGPNAGHTLVIGSKKFVFHTLPSGVVQPNTKNVLGSGMVLDPVVFLKEIDLLNQENIDLSGRLYLSGNLHLIIPTHRMVDAFFENREGVNKIGSTLKGIGPCYQDKYGRRGLKLNSILQPGFREKYEKLKKYHLELLCDIDENALNEAESEWFSAIEKLKDFEITDTEIYLNGELEKGCKVLAEGAQGALLDVNFGTYPYVTSSNTISSGCCTGLGISPRYVRNIFGVFKAYTTRVGSGPFPTELQDETGEYLTQKGFEFGSTTGRKRRCGWLDLVALQYSIMLNGVTHLIITKPDVLSGLDEIKVCLAYKDCENKPVSFSSINWQTELKTDVFSFEGWIEDISGIRDFNNLPEMFKNYLTFIEEKTKTPISIISVGPERNQTIIKKELPF